MISFTGTTVKYLYMPPNQKPTEAKEVVVIYDLEAYPDEMRKKITLFKHFSKYFKSQKDKDTTDEDNYQLNKFMKKNPNYSFLSESIEEAKNKDKPQNDENNHKMERSKLRTYDSDIHASPDTTLYIRRFLRTR